MKRTLQLTALTTLTLALAAGCGSPSSFPARSAASQSEVAQQQPQPWAQQPPADNPGADNPGADNPGADNPGGTPQQIATDEPEDDPALQPWGLLGDPARPSLFEQRQYAQVVSKVTGMVSDHGLRRQAQRRGLSLVNVAWEDTGRAEGSSLGPNITDLTLQVRYHNGGRREQTALMPVIRLPNFVDRTADIPANRFFVRVGNQHDHGRLRSVPLTRLLSNIKRFAAQPSSILGSGNLLAKRDSHFLVSAQAVFLPIPKRGKAEFNPVAFNYQSAPGSPAVLAILVTRQGTSMTVVENRNDGGSSSWGQQLYFNNEGQRAAFTAERLSTVKQRLDAQGGARTSDDKSALQKGADVLFLVQVPLKHKHRGRLFGLDEDADGVAATSMAAPAANLKKMGSSRVKSDVEQAVLGHGRNRGPFSEGAGLKLERDPNFPIRITVQFYKATSNGVVSASDFDRVAKSIGAVYEHADFVGSLVMPQDDLLRPTAWAKVPAQVFPW